MRTPRCSPLPLLLWAPAVLGACGGSEQADPERSAQADPDAPNVVLITLDTTRADFLSCYGYPEETSPRLDALAAEGTRFDLAVSTSAVTPVSHAGILTGRFNREHGLRVMMAGSGFRIDDHVPTLADLFKDAGYATLAVHSALPVSPHFGLGRGFDVVEGFMPAGRNAGERVAARRSDESIGIVLDRLEETAGPFFLWLHLWDPHDMHQLPPEDFMPVAEELGISEQDQVRWTRAVYAAEVRYMDSQIGRLLDELERAGRLANTIIAVTADHGEGLGDHGWALHRILYQEEIHVPLIVRVPGIDPVDSVERLVRTVDVAPTLLDFAGLPASEGMSGSSLRPLMLPDPELPEAPRLAFVDQINGYDLNAGLVLEHRPQDDFSYCAMDTDWKLVWRPNHPQLSELFHLAEDPNELDNRWAWEHPEGLRLREALAGHAPWVSEPYPAETSADDKLVARALETLGYMGGEGGQDGPAWEWVCPELYEHREERLGRCSHCDRPLLMIARGK